MKRFVALSLALVHAVLGGFVLAGEIDGETLAQFVQRVSAEAQNNGEAGRICALKGVAAVGAKVKYQKVDGNGQVDCDGYRRMDCSGYYMGVNGPIFKFPDPKKVRLNAAGIHDFMAQSGAAQDIDSSGGSYEPEPGDAVFFHPHGGSGVSHIGIYLGRGYFVHASGSDGTLLHINSLDEHASRTGSPDTYTWRSNLVGYGDVSRLPLRTQAEREQMVAESGASREVRAGPNAVGGVYISPALIIDAIESDSTGQLDALEDQISQLNFDENPVQELPDLQPPDGFGENDRAETPRARLEGAAAYRELLRSILR